MAEYDRGPRAALARHFAAVPEPPVPSRFWHDWGPVFYRGRLDGTARLLCIGSDPGATERIAHRTFVGDAGQRVQGFLSKLGLTRSYVCLNAFSWGLFPSEASFAAQMLEEPSQLAWRNRLYDLVRSPHAQAVVAFGVVAREALRLWPGRAGLAAFEVPHPSSRDEAALLRKWRTAITALRATVTPDPDGNTGLPNYGAVFRESDYAPIPRRDLPFGVPTFLGDDARLRSAGGTTSVRRPNPDDRHTLIWTAPTIGPTS